MECRTVDHRSRRCGEMTGEAAEKVGHVHPRLNDVRFESTNSRSQLQNGFGKFVVVGLDVETLDVDSFGSQLFSDPLEVLNRKNQMFELRSVSVTNDSLKHSLGAAFAARSVDNAADSDWLHAARSSRGDVALSVAALVGLFAMLDAEWSFDLC